MIMEFEKPLALIAPYDLQCVSNLQFVYEGKLNDYQNENRVEKLCFPVTEKGVFSHRLKWLSSN
jgi:hypothetical protein